MMMMTVHISLHMGGFVSCCSARVYLTLHRVLAPSTHDTPSKLVCLTGEHCLTFTGSITFFIRMSHCFTCTVWQCSQSSTYLALHSSWQPLSTVPNRTNTMMTTASGGGGLFMVLISEWCGVIPSVHNIERLERPTCPSVPPWLRSAYTLWRAAAYWELPVVPISSSPHSSLPTLLASRQRASTIKKWKPYQATTTGRKASRSDFACHSRGNFHVRKILQILVYQNILIFEK